MVSTNHYSIGWDVGGWNCDRNGNSRDAIVILDDKFQTVGKPWRGNLRTHINGASETASWIARLFELCGETANANARVTLAIDTPLGFPKYVLDLASKLQRLDEIGSSHTNPYLFRETERCLSERGFRPLSAIKDMIGSQATKGMHVLAKFAPQTERCGVWSDGNLLEAIETYPAPCKKSDTIRKLCSKVDKPHNEKDIREALTCALIAHMFRFMPNKLASPSVQISNKEGWIWLPKDARP